MGVSTICLAAELDTRKMREHHGGDNSQFRVCKWNRTGIGKWQDAYAEQSAGYSQQAAYTPFGTCCPSLAASQHSAWTTAALTAETRLMESLSDRQSVTSLIWLMTQYVCS